jgi:hypothetical protein
MKSTAAALALALALAASAIAAPPERRETCKFSTYRCTSPNTGIEICTASGRWELVGPCPKGTACENLPQDGFQLPFCTNTANVQSPGPSPGEKCQTPGKYDCAGSYAIQVCDIQNVLQFVGNCQGNSHSDYLNGIPYCVASV